MAEFPHLPLIQTLTGTHKPASNGRNKPIDPITAANIANRETYGKSLILATSNLKDERERIITDRRKAGLPDIPEETAIPIFLKVDTNLFNTESLKGMGIDIIAEELNGYIIGASTDSFASLQAKIEKFINEEGKYKNQAAQLWEINTGTSWKTEQILCENLLQKWPSIQDVEIFTVDISVACYIATPVQPQQNKEETDEQFQARIERWHTKAREISLRQSDLADAREESIQRFLSSYNADINPESVQFDDSFCFRVTLSGAALKDFVLNYPYVFEVVEYSENEQPISINGQPVDNDLDIIAPEENAPQICIIDSGIQENHRLLSESILSNKSVNYDTFDNTTSDLYGNGGHGTRVAGAILFGENIPSTGVFRPHCFLLNARVLNKYNQMSSSLYPPALIKDIVNNFQYFGTF
ncbi:S8 family serine peptidase [Flavobacterium sp. ZS1P14]|uniref:S8 family serine peptidase n=1 Tax=Flavobacterium sp. ZS1P14 TaxID=3401729 RepID=UPI003AB08F51